MFIVLLRFSDNKAQAGQYMEGHNAWLKRGFDDGVFLVAGSLQPKLGGGILAHNTSLADLQLRVSGDPFVAENVRRLRIIGWLVAVSPILLVIAQFARSELVARSTVADLALESIHVAFLPILVGGLLLVLAEVFAAGVRLREDTEGLV